MKVIRYVFFIIAVALTACNKGKTGSESSSDTTSISSIDPSKDWKFGIALWTFHTFDFPDALANIDSAGLTYIEPNTFQKSGPGLNDTLIGKLSPSGIAQLKTLIDQKELKAESVYITGDATIQSWKRQFEIAKQLGAKYVTGEPPMSLWDSVDSLAGVYGMKVAIHEHWKGKSHYWHPDSVLAAIKGHPNFGPGRLV